MTKTTKNELLAAGWKVAGHIGRWHRVVNATTGETVIVLQQNGPIYHAWGENWSASNQNVVQAVNMNGCIGDVLDNTRSYERAVLNAPEKYLQASLCLYHESSNLFMSKQF